MKLRAKKLACNLAALLLEEDTEAGLLECRYGSIESKGGPAMWLIRQETEELIEELRHRGRKI